VQSLGDLSVAGLSMLFFAFYIFFTNLYENSLGFLEIDIFHHNVLTCLLMLYAPAIAPPVPSVLLLHELLVLLIEIHLPIHRLVYLRLQLWLRCLLRYLVLGDHFKDRARHRGVEITRKRHGGGMLGGHEKGAGKAASGGPAERDQALMRRSHIDLNLYNNSTFLYRF
jgi:hypothetical protein